MHLEYRFCCYNSGYMFAYANPEHSNWETGYHVVGHMCPESNNCPDEQLCTNEFE
jgi:hypothetical protein